MKWIVSVEFRSEIQYHKFFSLLNRGLIRDAVLVNHSHVYKLIEFETTTAPELDKINKMGLAVQPKIVGFTSDEENPKI